MRRSVLIVDDEELIQRSLRIALEGAGYAVTLASSGAAALEIGTWLEARGSLHQPIASLTLGDLEAMASNAISRWIVMQTEKLQRAGWPPEDPIANFLLG